MGRSQRDFNAERRSGSRIGGGLRSAGRVFGLLGRELTKKAPAQQKSSSKISSPWLTKKRPYMQEPKAKSILGGMHVPKSQKQLEKFRLENMMYDSSKKDDPYFSRKEAKKTVERIRQEYGDVQAKEAERKLNAAFLGKNAISPKTADQALASVGQYGKDVRKGMQLIAQGFDKKHQSGRGAKYLTKEKLGSLIETTEKEEGRIAAHEMRKGFMVTDSNKDSSAAKSSSRIVGLREGLFGSQRRSGGGGDNKITNTNKP